MAKQADPTDGRKRCRWAAADSLLATYHDFEWGEPIRTDAGHLERMALEIFQCGLSWKIVLVKRAALRAAFEGFKPERVARFTARDVKRLCRNDSIIRNRRKIEATIHNADGFVRIAKAHGSYRQWLGDLPTEKPAERKALLPLFREQFRFMGPETLTCYLMGVGKIPPKHDRGCWRSGCNSLPRR